MAWISLPPLKFLFEMIVNEEQWEVGANGRSLCHLSHHKMACRGRFALSQSPENCEPQCGKIASTGAKTWSSPSQTPEPSNLFPSWVTHLLVFHYRSRDHSALCPWLTLCGAELLYSCEILRKGHSLFCTYGHLPVFHASRSHKQSYAEPQPVKTA